MDSTIQVLPTFYNGYSFRSRLEARWAVFFDCLKIKFEYEPEGFVFSDGEKYLPDFYLPTFNGGMYVEVKPEGGNFSKAEKFARESKREIWLAEGVPAPKAYGFYACIDDFQVINLDENLSPIGFVDGMTLMTGIPNADQAYNENRMYTCPGYENEDNSIDSEYWGYLGSHYLQAVHAARSWKFEFNSERLSLTSFHLYEKIEAFIQELADRCQKEGQAKDGIATELLKAKFLIVGARRRDESNAQDVAL